MCATTIPAQDPFLNPVSDEKPAGEPAGAEFKKSAEELKKAGRWQDVRLQCEDQLQHSSKDLDLGSWYCQALIGTEGFDGAAKGLMVLRGLLNEFWDKGLHPADDRDRKTSLKWLNTDLAARLREIPLTASTKDKTRYSYRQYNEAVQLQSNASDTEYVEKKRQEGWTTMEAWDAAVAESPGEFYASLETAVEQIRVAHAEIAAFAGSRLNKLSPNLADCSAFLADLHAFVQSLAAKRPAPKESKPAAPHGQSVATAPATTPPGSASHQDPLSRIREVASGEPTGRDRFFRKLEVARLFMSDQRPIAKLILKDLAQEIDERKLVEWESSVAVAEIWTLLYECFQGDGETDTAAEVLQKLCKLAPWHASRVTSRGRQ